MNETHNPYSYLLVGIALVTSPFYLLVAFHDLLPCLVPGTPWPSWCAGTLVGDTTVLGGFDIAATRTVEEHLLLR